jgi:hypothetical protein
MHDKYKDMIDENDLMPENEEDDLELDHLTPAGK